MEGIPQSGNKMHLVYRAGTLLAIEEELKKGGGKKTRKTLTVFVTGGLSWEGNPLCIQQMGCTCMTKPSLKARDWQVSTILWEVKPGTSRNQFNPAFYWHNASILCYYQQVLQPVPSWAWMLLVNTGFKRTQIHMLIFFLSILVLHEVVHFYLSD